jgi:hypothetical protein
MENGMIKGQTNELEAVITKILAEALNPGQPAAKLHSA